MHFNASAPLPLGDTLEVLGTLASASASTRSDIAVHRPSVSGGKGSATGNVCVPPGAARAACGHPPYVYRPSYGCTAAQGCCFDRSKAGRDWCYPRVNSSTCADKCLISVPAAGLFPRSRGSGNMVYSPMPDAEVTARAKSILAPYPRAASKTDDVEIAYVARI